MKKRTDGSLLDILAAADNDLNKLNTKAKRKTTTGSKPSEDSISTSTSLCIWTAISLLVLGFLSVTGIVDFSGEWFDRHPLSGSVLALFCGLLVAYYVPALRSYVEAAFFPIICAAFLVPIFYGWFNTFDGQFGRIKTPINPISVGILCLGAFALAGCFAMREPLKDRLAVFAGISLIVNFFAFFLTMLFFLSFTTPPS